MNWNLIIILFNSFLCNYAYGFSFRFRWIWNGFLFCFVWSLFGFYFYFRLHIFSYTIDMLNLFPRYSWTTLIWVFFNYRIEFSLLEMSTLFIYDHWPVYQNVSITAILNRTEWKIIWAIKLQCSILYFRAYLQYISLSYL